MAETTINNSSEWLHLYQESLHAQHMLNNNYSLFPLDASMVATTIDSPRNGITSPPLTSPSNPNNHKDSCFSKPIRKRSRASKKTPTTHLNATAINFRDVVQKYTGCPKKSMSFGSGQTGPINLNFKLGAVQNQLGSRNILSPYGYDYGQYQLQQSQQKQVLEEEKGSSVACSFDGYDQINGVSSDQAIIDNNLKVVGDGFMSNDFDLCEYSTLEESFSK